GDQAAIRVRDGHVDQGHLGFSFEFFAELFGSVGLDRAGRFVLSPSGRDEEKSREENSYRTNCREPPSCSGLRRAVFQGCPRWPVLLANCITMFSENKRRNMYSQPPVSRDGRLFLPAASACRFCLPRTSSHGVRLGFGRKGWRLLWTR